MNKICWWLVDKVSQVLEPSERDVVRGDFVELNQTGSQALRDVLGLVVRRQAGLSYTLRPWLILVGLVAPLGLLLALVSRRIADGDTVYAWMYFSNLDMDLFASRAFWITLVQTIILVLPDILALICLSWTVGFLLGAQSGRTIRVIGAAFGLVLLFGVFVAVPRYTQLQIHSLPVRIQQGLERHAADHSAFSSLRFYTLMFPLLVQVLFVLLPTFWGMYNGLRVTIPLFLRTILWAPMFAAMAMQGAWWVALGAQNWVLLRRSWQMPPCCLSSRDPCRI
jgi:hypothetical protein